MDVSYYRTYVFPAAPSFVGERQCSLDNENLFISLNKKESSYQEGNHFSNYPQTGREQSDLLCPTFFINCVHKSVSMGGVSCTKIFKKYCLLAIVKQTSEASFMTLPFKSSCLRKVLRKVILFVSYRNYYHLLVSLLADFVNLILRPLSLLDNDLIQKNLPFFFCFNLNEDLLSLK